jgi:hypothetical protein
MFGEDLPSLENRVEVASDKDEPGCARAAPQLRPGRLALWNANFEQGIVAKATSAKSPGRAAALSCRRRT